MVERGEEPDGIAGVIRCASFGLRHTMAQRNREKSWVAPNSGGGKRNLGLKPGFDGVLSYECLPSPDGSCPRRRASSTPLRPSSTRPPRRTGSSAFADDDGESAVTSPAALESS